MKLSIAILCIVCGLSLSSVAYNTEHYSDASIISYGLSQMGFNPTVQISTTSAGTSYFVLYYDDWYNSDNDLNKVLYALFGCAAVSEITDWSSVMAIIAFEDMTISMTTADARTLYNYIQNNGEADQYALSFLYSHISVVEQGLADI